MHGWSGKTIQAPDFLFQSYIPDHIQKGEPLTIFIEGDGLAWLSKKKPSQNPTPVSHLVLKMALMHPETNATYLARPCQFTGTTNCSSKFWLQNRFSPIVVNNMDKAITTLKHHFDSEKIILVGYSGGGAIAALIASTRQDVTHLITVAGNLDHKAWTEHHRITPLKGSLNPIDYAPQLQKNGVKQTHFIGRMDTIIPLFLTHRFVNSQRTKGIEVIELDGVDHTCCWDKQWPVLWKDRIEAKNQI